MDKSEIEECIYSMISNLTSLVDNERWYSPSYHFLAFKDPKNIIPYVFIDDKTEVVTKAVLMIASSKGACIIAPVGEGVIDKLVSDILKNPNVRITKDKLPEELHTDNKTFH